MLQPFFVSLTALLVMVTSLSYAKGNVAIKEADNHIVRKSQSKAQVPIGGDPLCPCLSVEELNSVDDTLGVIGSETNLDTYGVSCIPHDIDTDACKDPCDSSSPLIGCDRNWCSFEWCYVDPTNCSLQKAPSTYFAGSNRYFSYATCRTVDVFFSDLAQLQGETIRIGLTANTGGWRGSFTEDAADFEGPLSKWMGPAVDFVKEAASIGSITLEITKPPDFLKEPAEKFFASKSSFDLCTYAATLGFVDLCIGQYTITETMSTSSGSMVLNSELLFLILEGEEAGTSFIERIDQNIRTIFASFTNTTWAFIVCFVVPVFGLLFIAHELGVPGSIFPKTKMIMIVDDFEETAEVQERVVPWYEHVAHSLYVSFLSVLQMTYTSQVVSVGAKLNLLGFTFFTLTTLAVYTANLAAILTNQRFQTPVANIEEAIQEGMRLCVDRRNIVHISSLHGIDPSFFVVDPEDGMPGFNCPNCLPRRRVFDYLSYHRARNNDKRYCHAAIAARDDLDVLQANGLHCNKTVVGSNVGEVLNGLPVFEGIAHKLIPLMLKLKNNGVYHKQLRDRRPKPNCKVTSLGTANETVSLTILQLSGIWFVSFAFALVGLLTTLCFDPCFRAWYQSKYGRIRIVYGYDQAGQKINFLKQHDDWVSGESCDVDNDGERVFLKESMRLSRTDSGYRTGSSRQSLHLGSGRQLLSAVWSNALGSQEKANETDVTVATRSDGENQGTMRPSAKNESSMMDESSHNKIVDSPRKKIKRRHRCSRDQGASLSQNHPSLKAILDPGKNIDLESGTIPSFPVSAQEVAGESHKRKKLTRKKKKRKGTKKDTVKSMGI